MKTLFVTAASLAALTLSAPAFAAVPSTTVTINGTNPAQCNVTATQTTVTLVTNAISTANGFINPNLAASVAGLLNGAGINAWCTGNTNGVVLSRTALTTGAGSTSNGFAQGAIYDLQMAIPDAARADSFPVLEDTVDGVGNGPGIGAGSVTSVSRFGPSGNGSPVTFAVVASNTPSAVTNGTAAGQGPTSLFTPTPARLVAGPYSGTVTLTLTPGI